MDLLGDLEAPYLKTDIPHFQVGDTVEVKFQIREGDKERLQAFTGTVIRRKGSGIRETFTVRRIVDGEGVERIFPIHSPKIGAIDVKRHGKVRRAKLYYLRDRTGKATRIREELFRDAKLQKQESAAESMKQQGGQPSVEESPAAAEPLSS